MKRAPCGCRVPYRDPIENAFDHHVVGAVEERSVGTYVAIIGLLAIAAPFAAVGSAAHRVSDALVRLVERLDPSLGRP